MSRNLLAIVVVALGLGAWATVAQAHPDYGCESCHVPHNSVGDHNTVPLWNPAHQETALLADAHYSGSNTLDATLTGPTGASKLCLSCHDGSYSAIASTHSKEFSATGGMGLLENTHPISFDYAEVQALDDELKPIDQLPEGAVDGNGDMQCISCHDVHATAADYGSAEFANLRWLYDNVRITGQPTVLNNAAFCRNCHLK
jgi:hypothetical protein